MPQGTLFPAIDGGGDPGDNPDIQSDITDLPLEPMSSLPEGAEPGFEGGDGLPALPGSEIAGGGQHRFLEEGGQAFDTPAAPAQPADVQLPTGERAGRKRSAEERIRKLVGRYHQKTDENAVLREEIGTLSSQMTQLQKAILSGAVPAQPSQGLMSNPNVTPGSEPDLETRIAQRVEAALAPIMQTVTNNSRQAQLNAAHGESVAEAIEDFPDLADPKSKFAQQFRQLFTQSPLRELADGPYQVAMQVRGILADEKANERAVASRKRAAVVHTPTPQIPEQVASAGPSAQEKSAYASAMQKFRSGTYEFSDYKTIRVLRDRYKQLR